MLKYLHKGIIIGVYIICVLHLVDRVKDFRDYYRANNKVSEYSDDKVCEVTGEFNNELVKQFEICYEKYPNAVISISSKGGWNKDLDRIIDLTLIHSSFKKIIVRDECFSACFLLLLEYREIKLSKHSLVMTHAIKDGKRFRLKSKKRDIAHRLKKLNKNKIKRIYYLSDNIDYYKLEHLYNKDFYMSSDTFKLLFSRTKKITITSW